VTKNCSFDESKLVVDIQRCHGQTEQQTRRRSMEFIPQWSTKWLVQK